MEYADANDYKKYTMSEDEPAKLPFLLRTANFLVDIVISKCRYDPTNEAHVQAAKDAVCAQIYSWQEASTSAFNDNNVSSYSVDELSVSYANQAVSSRKLCIMSYNYLLKERLIDRKVRTV